MSKDLPTDVRTVLTQLFTEGRAAVEAGDFETARATTESAATVASNKLPEGALRERLLHGCTSVTALLAADGEGETAVAAEYLRAMARRVEER